MGAERPASTSSRNARVCGSSVLSKADPRELPARCGRKEVAVGSTAVPTRRGAAGALQHALPAHELAIIFADRALCGREAWVREVRACRPFPHIAEHAAARSGNDRACAIELISDIRVGGGR